MSGTFRIIEQEHGTAIAQAQAFKLTMKATVYMSSRAKVHESYSRIFLEPTVERE